MGRPELTKWPAGKHKAPDPSVTGKSTEDRVLALAYGAIAALPASLRGRAEAHYQHGTLPRLKGAMAAWIRGTRLDRDTFANLFFGREAKRAHFAESPSENDLEAISIIETEIDADFLDHFEGEPGTICSSK